MAVHHPGDLQQEVGNLQNLITQLVKQATQNASFGSAGLRVYGGGWIVIENGGLSVTGTAQVSGTLTGDGTFDWDGPWYLNGVGRITGDTTGTGRLAWEGSWSLDGNGEITGDVTISGNVLGTGRFQWNGPWDLRGAGEIKGNVNITGALDVLNRLTLGPSGYIEAGTVRIDRAGTYGGRIASTGAALELAATGSVIIDAPYLIATDISAKNGSFIGTVSALTLEAQTKNFRIPHPLDPDMVLRHGATESPVSGVEYWGDEVLPESGRLAVFLPDYFEALTKPGGRAVLVTGRGFAADWGDVADGAFTVTGVPGGRFSWLVKAERRGAEFVLEEPVYGPRRKAAS